VAKVRVVPDTNVYISALLWTGIPHRLLGLAETGELTLVTTPAIMEELREVLGRPKFRLRINMVLCFGIRISPIRGYRPQIGRRGLLPTLARDVCIPLSGSL
jgi:hypothetical protein